MTHPALHFLRRLVSPDDLGHAVSPEVRRLAAALLAAEAPAEERERIYLSGPMTGLPECNFPAFHAAARRLRAQGHTVVNPAELNPDPGTPWTQCLRVDLRAMLTCSRIVLLPGWHASDGAHLELHVAHRVGIAVDHVSEIAP